ncbi:MAG: hypothetical protein JXA58_08065 [Dehalococcoidia bacterium]|nr:hypothetical protein [Dehalococcoidia bacterium]
MSDHPRRAVSVATALPVLLAMSVLCGCSMPTTSSNVAMDTENTIESRVTEAAREAFGDSLVSAETFASEGSLQAKVELSVTEVSDTRAFAFLDRMVELAGDSDDVFIDLMLHQNDGTADVAGLIWYRDEGLLYRQQTRLETWDWPVEYESYVQSMAKGMTESAISAVVAGESAIPEFVAPEWPPQE